MFESFFESPATALNVNAESVPILLVGTLGLIIIVSAYGIMSISEKQPESLTGSETADSPKADKE